MTPILDKPKKGPIGPAFSRFSCEHEGTSRLGASETLTAAKTHDVNE